MDPYIRRNVRERAHACCEYCRLPDHCSQSPPQVDHIIAIKHGGSDSIDNLAWRCFRCNVFKGASIAGLDPETQYLTPLFHPRRDAWSEHFLWDGPRITGHTPIGRTTVAVLRINLSVRVEHRWLLITTGELIQNA